MFSTLRANNQLYILHKDAEPRVEIGSVTGVSTPKPKYPATPQFPGTPVEMVVDVSVSVGGQATTFQNLPSGADIADFGPNGNIVISSSREAMSNEVAAMKQKSIDILNSVDYHKSVIGACEKMAATLNPEYADKQRQEIEIKTLKGQMEEMARNMSDLMQMNRQLMEQLGVTEPQKTN